MAKWGRPRPVWEESVGIEAGFGRKLPTEDPNKPPQGPAGGATPISSNCIPDGGDCEMRLNAGKFHRKRWARSRPSSLMVFPEVPGRLDNPNRRSITTSQKVRVASEGPPTGGDGVGPAIADVQQRKHPKLRGSGLSEVPIWSRTGDKIYENRARPWPGPLPSLLGAGCGRETAKSRRVRG